MVKLPSPFYITSDFLGITIAATIYASIPLPAQAVNKTHASLTIVGSMSKYSAIPPHTPSNFFPCSILYNLFFIITTIPFFASANATSSKGTKFN